LLLRQSRKDLALSASCNRVSTSKMENLFPMAVGPRHFRLDLRILQRDRGRPWHLLLYCHRTMTCCTRPSGRRSEIRLDPTGSNQKMALLLSLYPNPYRFHLRMVAVSLYPPTEDQQCQNGGDQSDLGRQQHWRGSGSRWHGVCNRHSICTWSHIRDGRRS
ncbi:MAG: hypothetical protein JWO08_1451, partial [Verrucomicrobiaceae bacterium]|nr:hypothetical protein [Verrucomicrobiaceae bacterium]